MTQRWVCRTPHCRTIDISGLHCTRCGFDQICKSRDQCVLRNAIFDGDIDTAVREIARIDSHQSSTRKDPIVCFQITNIEKWRFAFYQTLEDETIPGPYRPIIELVQTGRYRGREVNPYIWGFISPIDHVKLMKFLHRNGVRIRLENPLPAGFMTYANYHSTSVEGVVDVIEFLTSIRAIDPMRHIPALQWNDGIGAGLNDVKDYQGIWYIARVDYGTRRIHFLMFNEECDEDLTPATQIKPPYSMSQMPRGTTFYEMAKGIQDGGKMAEGIARGLEVYSRNLDGVTKRIAPLLPFVRPLSKLIASYLFE